MAKKYQGWAYVSGTAGEGADGPVGAVQYHYQNTIQTGSSNFVYVTGSDALYFTGSIYVSGTVVSNNYDVINHTVSYLSASGDSKFGDDAADQHQFTGSVTVNGPPLCNRRHLRIKHPTSRWGYDSRKYSRRLRRR